MANEEMVYDANTIASNATAPTDIGGIRDSVYAKYGIPEATKNVTDTQAKLRNVDIDVDDAISMSKLVGQRGKASDALNNQLQSYAEVLSAAQSQADLEFGDVQAERSKIEQLMLTAPDAGITFSDTFESAVGKYNENMKDIAEKEQEEFEKAQKKGDYDALFAAYGTTSSARPKGMSKKEYLKELEKEYGSLSDTQKFSTSSGGSGSGGKTYTTQVKDEDGNTVFRTTDANGNVLVLRDTAGNELEEDVVGSGFGEDQSAFGAGVGDTVTGAGNWWDSFKTNMNPVTAFQQLKSNNAEWVEQEKK